MLEAPTQSVTYTLTTRFSQSAFGECLSGKDAVNAFRFVGGHGGMQDDATGLVQFWNRWLDPSVGRWVSEDRIRQYDGSNLFRYVGNSPVRFFDPTGLYRLPADFAKNYPSAVARIGSLASRLNQKKYSAFLKYGQADAALVQDAMRDGNEPNIVVEDLLNAFGEYRGAMDKTTIYLDKAFLEDYEFCRLSDKLLDATVEHESVHYFDDKDGVDYPGEEGNFYEIDVYGEITDRLTKD
jgi:RHS repeat-associated protein